jgi:hypothetical protein
MIILLIIHVSAFGVDCAVCSCFCGLPVVNQAQRSVKLQNNLPCPEYANTHDVSFMFGRLTTISLNIVEGGIF